MIAAPISEIVLARRSVRRFTDSDVPDHVVEDLIAAALWSPSPHNSQPWRFTILGPASRTRLAEGMADQLEVELRADGIPDGVAAAQSARSRERISQAPASVLCSLVTDGLVEYDDERRRSLEWQMAVQSVGAVLQTLFLLAHERGLGTCWMAAPMYCQTIVRRVLDLPEAYAPQALVLIGYPAHPGKWRPRRPLDEIVTHR